MKAGGLAVNHNEIPRSSQPVKTALKPDVLDLPELNLNPRFSVGRMTMTATSLVTQSKIFRAQELFFRRAGAKLQSS